MRACAANLLSRRGSIVVDQTQIRGKPDAKRVKPDTNARETRTRTAPIRALSAHEPWGARQQSSAGARAPARTSALAHARTCDYLNVDSSIEEGVYDAAFYMESSLHCENRTKTFLEAFRRARA
eukprot:2168064-Pleurochrysis_carterae.AAC.1